MQENGPAILISVPSHFKKDDHIQYILHIQDLKSNFAFETDFRYSQLKKLNEALETIKVPLPKFPSTNWWRSTNSNPELIEERREGLDNYFRSVLSIKSVRECLIMKNFILEASKEYDKKVEKVCKSQIQKEQKEKLKNLEKLGEQQPQKKQKKIKNHSKFATPACQPVQEPVEETRERSQSYEEQQQQPAQSKSNPGSRKGSAQLHQLNFGGTKIYRGILSNAKQANK